MKIVALDMKAIEGEDLSLDMFKQYGEMTVYPHVADEDETIRRIGDADILLTCKTLITKKVLDSCKNLRYIGIISTGYDAIDVDYARKLGIPVCNVPSYATSSVAQLTMALMLELCYKVGEHSRSVHNGDWIRATDFCYWLGNLSELTGKTLGIIGYGRIGKEIKKMAEAFGMKVIANSPHYENSVALAELYAQSDIISLNCRLSEENRGMINAASIAKMKDGVWIINTARGPLINEPDLVDALKSGKVGAAAVDVICGEPMKEDSPMLDAPNCIITPHIAWATTECRKKLIDLSFENLKCFLEGKPQNVVNPQ